MIYTPGQKLQLIDFVLYGINIISSEQMLELLKSFFVFFFLRLLTCDYEICLLLLAECYMVSSSLPG